MKILLTGAAGFIGFYVCKSLLENGHQVIGIDNINNYYDVNLKFARLNELGIEKTEAEQFHNFAKSSVYPEYQFIRMNLGDREKLRSLFEEEEFNVVCHLAAQAGVRYSIDNPESYIESNVVGFLNILENCRHHGVEHLVYASSSSVYGNNKKVPFETTDPVDHPISLYAATKKSNELMAYTYSHLYGFATTGLRFFTVYGPWGRPDMAYFLFTKAILNGKPIKVFNEGNLERDFTYIDDIAEGVVKVLEKSVLGNYWRELYKIYNIGNNKSIKLLDFIRVLEDSLGKKAELEMLPMQPGDVVKTWANVDELISDYDYRPDTSLEEGIESFVRWYRDYINRDAE